MRKFLLIVLFLTAGIQAFAQISVSGRLLDASTSDPVGFATVSLTKSGAQKPSKYVLSKENGTLEINGVAAGQYVLKAELLGYKTFEKNITVNASLNLGDIKMKPDQQQLEAAQVSAVGNSILVKKDTIEYNANAFKLAENDVLEDLLKKLPGVEVSESGTITVNGEEIKKITIEGKTFFLDDPQLASKNLPAKIINKLKVVEKKSEQAEFTGIDDGETETVIDLSIKKGMMKGLFGNVSAGGGHDLPTDMSVNSGDWRFQGAGFLGQFKDNSQISVILNGNNTNNRGFNDLAGSMMGGMRGGRNGGGMGSGQGGWGSGNGITTSWMAGANGVWDLFDKKMELGGNYLYNGTDNVVEEASVKTAFQQDGNNLVYKSGGTSDTKTQGHRFGIRLNHKFSDNTSILFEPRVNFGGGNFAQHSEDTTYNGSVSGPKVNSALVNNDGFNKNVSTSGFLLFRQRLGIPGRTLTVMARYSYSNNNLEGHNYNSTTLYDEQNTNNAGNPSIVDQFYKSNEESVSLMGRATYTEPVGHNFYVEANYMYSWNRSQSWKDTYEADQVTKVLGYCNQVTNTYVNQEIGVNALYQKPKIRAQLGVSAKPTETWNETTKAGKAVDPFHSMVWNWAPQAMVWWEMSDNSNMRMFYRGTSSQPSTSQLIPIPDNSNPLNVSYGNPSLQPYFTHRLRGDVRYNNKKKFSSFNIRFGGEYKQNPIVNSMWYYNGAQYSMPLNGPDAANANIQGFLNLPIAKSSFSVLNFTRFNWNYNTSFVGKDIDMSKYLYPAGDPLAGQLNYDIFLQDYNAGLLNFADNRTNTLGFTERLKLTYRKDAIEAAVSGQTRMNKSWYSLQDSYDNTLTWNNKVRAEAIWTWNGPGLVFKGEFDFNWYRGYSYDMSNEYILNLEIQKLLFKKKCTIALKGYDILGQAKNLTVDDNTNYYKETVNNTLGRYIILSFTYRFGTFDSSKMRGPGGHGGPGGPGGYGPPMR